MAYSRYGHLGKGLTDRGERAYASGLASKYGSTSIQVRDYTTFVDKLGIRRATGTWQAMGHTAASLGFGQKSFSELYGHLPSGAQASLKRTFKSGGYDPTTGYGAVKAFAPYGGVPQGSPMPKSNVQTSGRTGDIRAPTGGIWSPQGNLFESMFKGVADPSGNRGSGGWLSMLRRRGGVLGAPQAEESEGRSNKLSLGIALILLKVLS